MAKVVDITDKLDFDSNPFIKIKDKEFEVNADAETVLKIMGVLNTAKNMTSKEVIKMYELIFPQKTRKEIAGLNLQFNDFQKVVETAIDLITDTGEADQQGE